MRWCALMCVDVRRNNLPLADFEQQALRPGDVLVLSGKPADLAQEELILLSQRPAAA